MAEPDTVDVDLADVVVRAIMNASITFAKTQMGFLQAITLEGSRDGILAKEPEFRKFLAGYLPANNLQILSNGQPLNL